MTTDMTDGV